MEDIETIGVKTRLAALTMLATLCSRYYGTTYREMCSGDRHRHIADARKAYCYLAKRLTGYTLREIAFAVGLDYSSVHYCVRQYEVLLQTSVSTMGMYKELEAEASKMLMVKWRDERLQKILN